MKTRNKLFHLELYCLVLLIITATLLVGGPFSKFTFSSSDVSGIPSLIVAGLKEEDIEIMPLDPDSSRKAVDGFEAGVNKVILYAFKIINNSEVSVTCGLDFWAYVSKVSDLDAKEIPKINILLYANGEVLDCDVDGFSGAENDNINVSTDEEAIFVKEETICAIVLDFGECDKSVLADTLWISPGVFNDKEHEDAVTLTVKQAKEKKEES